MHVLNTNQSLSVLCTMKLTDDTPIASETTLHYFTSLNTKSKIPTFLFEHTVQIANILRLLIFLLEMSGGLLLTWRVTDWLSVTAYETVYFLNRGQK